MTPREKAHNELAHALTALGDALAVRMSKPAAGHFNLRPVATAVIQTLSGRDGAAWCALRNAEPCVAAFFHRSAPGYLPALRKLAPVLLDVYCDAKGIE